MTQVNVEALRLLLSPPSECPQIGAEVGLTAKEGISTFISPFGSVRYVYARSGRIVAALQVMVGGGTATATNVFTDPDFRRQGLAAQLAARAKIDHDNLQFSEERSPDGQAWVHALQESPGKRFGAHHLQAILERMAREAPEELEAVLLRHNDPSGATNEFSNLMRPGDDDVKTRTTKISSLLTWLKSDAALVRQANGAKIDPDWRYHVCRLRHLAGITPKTFYEALLGHGFRRLPNGHARNYTFADGEMLPTLTRAGVRLSMSSGTELYEDRGRIMAGYGEPTDWVINALLVDPECQRKGLATATMCELVRLADQFGVTLYLEATPIYDKAMSREQLTEFYAKHGFSGDAVKVRTPGTQEQLLLYHGTRSAGDELRPSRGGEFGSGIYLTADESTAWKYAERAQGEAAPRVLAFRVDLRNPFISRGREAARSFGPSKLKARGHDGIIGILPGGEKQYVVFDADRLHQIELEDRHSTQQERSQA